MKITKKHLQRIVEEETQAAIDEEKLANWLLYGNPNKPPAIFVDEDEQKITEEYDDYRSSRPPPTEQGPDGLPGGKYDSPAHPGQYGEGEHDPDAPNVYSIVWGAFTKMVKMAMAQCIALIKKGLDKVKEWIEKYLLVFAPPALKAWLFDIMMFTLGLLDPTGINGWPDAAAAMTKAKKSMSVMSVLEAALAIFCCIPLIGKLGTMAKAGTKSTLAAIKLAGGAVQKLKGAIPLIAKTVKTVQDLMNVRQASEKSWALVASAGKDLKKGTRKIEKLMLASMPLVDRRKAQGWNVSYQT